MDKVNVIYLPSWKTDHNKKTVIDSQTFSKKERPKC